MIKSEDILYLFVEWFLDRNEKNIPLFNSVFYLLISKTDLGVKGFKNDRKGGSKMCKLGLPKCQDGMWLNIS